MVALPALAALVALAAAPAAPAAPATFLPPDGRFGPELLLYAAGDGSAAIPLLEAHGHLIDGVAPQAFGVGADGVVRGGVSDGLLEAARRAGVRVVPLIHNPGFDQGAIRGLLADPAARARVVAFMVARAGARGFDGWQFDFENFPEEDAAVFTAFYREAAAALLPRGLELSVAVVPRRAGEPATSYGRWMRRNWRGGFQVAELASAGTFVSYMTYAQHGSVSTPGPIATPDWMRETLERALAEGVPASSISLGIPFYSGHWRAGWDGDRGPGVRGRELSYEAARSLLDGAGVEPEWSGALGVAWAAWPEDGVLQWLFLEDRRSLDVKLAVFDEYPGLRGISVWVAGAEAPGVWDVIEDWKGRNDG